MEQFNVPSIRTVKWSQPVLAALSTCDPCLATCT
ncbi:hypothetical protein WN943_020224 [Citrus x changshan-huyou]